MTISNDVLGIASDGTLQRFTLSTPAVADAADLDLTEDEVLAVANDPDSADALDRVPHLRAPLGGEIRTLVDTRADLCVWVRGIEPVDDEWAAAA